MFDGRELAKKLKLNLRESVALSSKLQKVL